MTRLEDLVHQFSKLRTHHSRISHTVKDAAGYLTPAGAAHAKKCLQHSAFTITQLKTAIIAELEI